VIYSGDGYYDGELVYDLAECPECGYEYEEGDKDWGLPFCPKCGQALEWEVEDEVRSIEKKRCQRCKHQYSSRCRIIPSDGVCNNPELYEEVEE